VDSQCQCSRKPGEYDRRQILQGALFLTALRPECCGDPDLPAGSLAFDAGDLTIDLRRAPLLRKTGAAFQIVDESRSLDHLIIHAAKDRYVATHRKCTHGGAPCAYNHKLQVVQCTCFGHSKWDLEGRLLGGLAKKPLATYEVTRSGDVLRIRLEAKS